MATVYESFGLNRKTALKHFDNFNNAFDAIAAGQFGKVICLEADEDQVDCADAFMADGRILVVEAA